MAEVKNQADVKNHGLALATRALDRMRSVQFWASLALWLLPTCMLFVIYWPLAQIDNGTVQRSGDVATILRHTCDVFDHGPHRLLVSHADHIIVTIYLLAMPLVLLFGNDYAPYAAVLLASYGVAFSAIGVLIRSISGSWLAGAATALMLAGGWWLTRGALVDYSQVATPLVVIFTVLAIQRAAHAMGRTTWRNIATICLLSLAAALTVAPGMFVFVAVGAVWGLVWLYLQLRSWVEEGRWRFVAPDWRLLAALVLTFMVCVGLYAVGNAWLGNPDVGGQNFDRTGVSASVLERTISVTRAGASNLFGPNQVADGSMRDSFFVIDHSIRNVALAIGTIMLGLALGATFLVYSAVRTGDRRQALAGIVALASLVLCVLVSLASVLGRDALLLSFTRYLMLPLTFFAIAFGVLAGYAIQSLKTPGPRWGVRAALVGLAVLCTWNQQIFVARERPSLERLRMFLIERPVADWWSDCPLVLE